MLSSPARCSTRALRVGSAALLVAAAACVHHTPRVTVLGKRVGLGELRGDNEVKSLLKDALAERFELDAENAELHFHIDASLSGFDEQVVSQLVNPQPPMMTVYRRVETLRATVRLVRDATGEVLALSVYELQEKGPERPRDSRAGDELGIILARRAVRMFIDQHKL